MACSYNLDVFIGHYEITKLRLLRSYSLINNESQLTDNGSKLFLYIKKNNIEWKNDPR
jgi:hypothetical protein